MKYKKLLLAVCVLAVLGLLLGTAVLVVNGHVKAAARPYLLSPEAAADLVHTDCILVLGCGVRPNGEPSLMLQDRLDMGLALYEAGAAPKLLMSGDHSRSDYDEVNAMKDYVMDRGVPSDDVFMDHAGFSTYESMYRARDIFQAKKLVIVSQEYHLYRAVYDARQLGLDAWGVAAEDMGAEMDYLFGVSQSTGLSMDALTGILESSAPSMQALGFSFEETANMAGLLDKAGMDANGTMSKMNKALVELAVGELDHRRLAGILLPADVFMRRLNLECGRMRQHLHLPAFAVVIRGENHHVLAAVRGVPFTRDEPAAYLGDIQRLFQHMNMFVRQLYIAAVLIIESLVGENRPGAAFAECLPARFAVFIGVGVDVASRFRIISCRAETFVRVDQMCLPRESAVP